MDVTEIQTPSYDLVRISTMDTKEHATEGFEENEVGFSKVTGHDDKNQDDAGRFIGQLGGITEFSAQEANRVRWKLDLILLPIVCIESTLLAHNFVRLTSAR